MLIYKTGACLVDEESQGHVEGDDGHHRGHDVRADGGLIDNRENCSKWITGI